jgi:hypothetical protein
MRIHLLPKSRPTLFLSHRAALPPLAQTAAALNSPIPPSSASSSPSPSSPPRPHHGGIIYIISSPSRSSSSSSSFPLQSGSYTHLSHHLAITISSSASRYHHLACLTHTHTKPSSPIPRHCSSELQSSHSGLLSGHLRAGEPSHGRSLPSPRFSEPSANFQRRFRPISVGKWMNWRRYMGGNCRGVRYGANGISGALRGLATKKL